jgi:hypothetical protein
VIQNSIGRGHESSSERETLAKETSGLVRGGGILGRGPASTVLSLRRIQAPYPKEAHDDFIATIVERGLMGVVGLAIFIVSLAGMSRTFVGKRLAPAWASVLPAEPFILGAVASLLVFALTHEILHERMLWALLGLVAATYAWGRVDASREAGA